MCEGGGRRQEAAVDGAITCVFLNSDPVLPILPFVQPIPADMRLLFAKGIPYCLLPNLDSVNHCTSKEISMEIKR
jgi:hypothetical protein